jgi:hypothetical protein
MSEQRRINTTREQGGITVRVPARKKGWLMFFLPIWLVFWTIGGVAAFTAFITGANREPFLIFWLIGWAFGETMATIIFLWTAFGEELISIQNGLFTYQRHVFGIGPKRQYQVQELSNVRASGYFGSIDGVNYALAQYGMTGGTVAVDNRHGEEIRFGIALNEYQAQNVAASLQPYLTNARSIPGHGHSGFNV